MRVPQEVLKQRVQVDIYPNAAVGFVKMVQDNGVGAFYKGYVATVSRDVPWYALSFMFFAQAKSIFKKVTGDAPTTDQNLALGALSGMTAAVIMTPVDVVKTRLMTGGATRSHAAAWYMRGPVSPPFPHRSATLTWSRCATMAFPNAS